MISNETTQVLIKELDLAGVNRLLRMQNVAKLAKMQLGDLPVRQGQSPEIFVLFTPISARNALYFTPYETVSTSLVFKSVFLFLQELLSLTFGILSIDKNVRWCLHAWSTIFVVSNCISFTEQNIARALFDSEK